MQKAAALLLIALAAAPTGAEAGRARAAGAESTPTVLPASNDPVLDDLIAQIRAALTDPSDGRLDVLLRSLRRVRDPGLRPLFAQLAAADRAVLRVHGILGLAELEPTPRVDMLLVKRLTDPREQLVVLGEALRAGMLPTEQLEDVARWPGLDPTLVVLVLGRLQRAGRDVDPAQFDVFLRPLNPMPEGGADPMPALLAALERCEQSAANPSLPPPDVSVLEEVLATPASADRDRIAVILLEYIRQERLHAATPFVRRLLESAQGVSAGRDVAFEALRALLAIAPMNPATTEAFARRFETADLAQRIRLGMALLETMVERPLLPPDVAGPPAPAAPPTLLALLAAESGNDAWHPILAKMARAGEAAQLGCSPEAAGAVAELIAEAHGPTVAWALRLARQCQGRAARDIALAVLDVAARDGAGLRPGESAMLDAAVAAAALLADIDPAALAAFLAQAAAQGNAAMERVVLSGALRSTNPAAAVLAAGAPVTNATHAPVALCLTDPTAAAMAALLDARHRAELTEDDFETLAGIARARIPQPPADALGEPLRLEAAWLALRCRGQQRIALARILADTPR